MRKLLLCATIAAVTLAGCSQSEPPACNNPEVLQLVEQLIDENAGAVFDQYVPRNDPMLLLKLMGLGIGMTDSRNFYIPKEQAELIKWEFSNSRTTDLNDAIDTRSCAISASFGSPNESTGSFTLLYTVGFNDDGEVIVSL